MRRALLISPFSRSSWAEYLFVFHSADTEDSKSTMEGKMEAVNAVGSPLSSVRQRGEPASPEKHIMISYQWSVQEEIVKISEFLRKNNYRVRYYLLRRVESSSVTAHCK